MNAQRTNPDRRQQGLTLIEMMIAMVLGLVLVAGAIQLLVANKQSYFLQDAMSRLQENGRFALQLLTRDVRMAGFHDPLVGPTPPAFYTDAAITGAAAADNLGGGVGDRLSVLRLNDAGIASDCLGQNATSNQAINVYWVGDTDGDGNTELLCRGGDPIAGNWLGPAQPLVDDVESLQVQYGIDGDGDGSVEQYQTADNVGDWAEVSTVRLALLLRTNRDNLREASSKTYTLLGQNVSSPNDGRIRNVFDTTVVLRNRLQ